MSDLPVGDHELWFKFTCGHCQQEQWVKGPWPDVELVKCYVCGKESWTDQEMKDYALKDPDESKVWRVKGAKEPC